MQVYLGLRPRFHGTNEAHFLSSHPTNAFKIFKPEDQEIGGFYVVRERRGTVCKRGQMQCLSSAKKKQNSANIWRPKNISKKCVDTRISSSAHNL